MCYIRKLFVTLVIILETIDVVMTLAGNNTCFCLKEELSTLRQPVHLETAVLDGKNVYLIAEQIGVILEYRPDGGNNKLTPYIDITDRVVSSAAVFEERGLLGFTLHPEFVTNKLLYLYYIRKFNGKDYTCISVIAGKNVSDETILLLIEQPGDRNNGGQLLFGDDGYLYVFVGDGEPGDSDKNHAQNGQNLLGKVLRLDVNTQGVSDFRPQYYGFPADNQTKAEWRPEIYAIGVRNMWRCSVDKGDKQGKNKGRIFCGELGTSIADEINLIKKGGNYGWNFREGNNCTNTTMCEITDTSSEVLPIYTFLRGETPITALIGGPVYRGSLFPEIYGHIVYGDFITGGTFSLQETKHTNGTTSWTPRDFPACDTQRCGCNSRNFKRTHLLAFGSSIDDELYLLMTDDTNPTKSKDALLKLVKPEGTGSVTCGSDTVFKDFSIIPFILIVTKHIVF